MSPAMPASQGGTSELLSLFHENRNSFAKQITNLVFLKIREDVLSYVPSTQQLTSIWMSLADSTHESSLRVEFPIYYFFLILYDDFIILFVHVQPFS